MTKNIDLPARGGRRATGAAGIAVLGLAAATLAAAPTTALAAGQASHAAACAQAKHRFVEADSATVSGKTVTVNAHHATFHCGGEDDGHYDVTKAKLTLTISSKAVIKVYRHPENPSVYLTVKASKLPHWLKVNRSEPIYQIKGPKHGITAMTEMFHP
jgi:hypothetical protein